MKFDTKFDVRPRKMCSHVGEPVKNQYIGRYDYNGDVELVEDGVRNVYDEIQSYADECSMDNILRRFASGDVSVLSKSQGVYVDASQLPEHFVDMCNLVAEVERKFNLLPVEERAAYENNFVKYALGQRVADAVVAADSAQPEQTEEKGAAE
jgi:hypothetical protein